MVKLYLISYNIGDSAYGARIPASSRKHAEEIAEKLGGEVLGSNIREKLAMGAEQLMEFCGACADEPIKWKFHASEMLEAFLTIGWPARTEEFDE